MAGIESAMNEIQQYGEYMRTLLLISIAFVSIVPLFLGLKSQRRRTTNIRLERIFLSSLYGSFAIGILALVLISDWFQSQERRVTATIMWGLQVILFVIATFTYWPAYIRENTRGEDMTRINKLDGVYLDSQFRRVEIYVCSREPQPHKFDIPIDSNQRSTQENKWFNKLEQGECPLC